MTSASNTAPGTIGDLYDRFGALAYRLALSITANPVVAERVVSEAFVSTWRGGDVSSKEFFPSVMRSVRTLAIQHRPAPMERDLTFVVSPRAENGREAAVTSALDALPEMQRSALALAYFGGLGVDAIASELRQPISNVKANLQAALRHLRSVLADRGGATV